MDIEASRRAFEQVRKEVNDHSKSEMSLDEIAYGCERFHMSYVALTAVYRFIKVANETMCRPIRALTEAKGYSTSKHTLATFGGAGGQHACEIARLLGINKVLIHRYSSILSAYGLALADRCGIFFCNGYLLTLYRVYELQEPSSAVYSDSSKPSLMGRLDALSNSAKEALKEQGFEDSNIYIERYLNMRFDGTDNAIMVLAPSANEGCGIQDQTDFETAFKRSYKGEFGFLLENKAIIVDDIKVRGIGKTFDSLGESVYEELRHIQKKDAKEVLSKKDRESSVYFGDGLGRVNRTPVYQLGNLSVGDVIHGPAMIIDDTQTIVVVPKSEAVVTSRHLYMTLHD